MEQPNQRSSELARKWVEGTITEEEKKEFSDWFNAAPDDPVHIPPSFAEGEEDLRQRLFRQILQRRRVRTLLPRWSRRAVQVAAAVAVVLSASILLSRFLPSRGGAQQAVIQKPVADSSVVATGITPGGNRAVLQLADGSRIVLDSAQNGTLTHNPATRVTKLADGQLRVSATGEPTAAAYNTLATPKGGQYAITLADGTNVWLNSASSLSFPSAFRGRERTVELKGEAYFEVARNTRQPFRVRVNGMEVAVLGTHFNIMAYTDEEAVQTTLLEGSVRIQNDRGNSLLKPGQQASVKAAGVIRVHDDVDTEQVLAWKNGLFQFEKTRIETIMRQLARWYGIEVVYRGAITDHFTGTISKQVGIENVFRMLALTGAVQFSISGSRVTVQP